MVFFSRMKAIACSEVFKFRHQYCEGYTIFGEGTYNSASIVHSLQFAVLSFSSSTIQIFFMKIIKSLSKAAAADIVLSFNQYKVDHTKCNLNVICTLSHF